MDLNFSKVLDCYVAEFEATGDFNLHIEGVDVRELSIYQRTSANGAYASVRGALATPPYGEVYDYDFTALVYPKHIKISCASVPTVAAVTFA